MTNPPDPNVYEQPLYLDPTSVFSSPIENRSHAWAWEGDIAMADWGDRIQNTRDTIRAEHYWATGRCGLAIEIISQNPNVGIEFRAGREFSGTIFGSQAAGFLTGLDRAIQAGSLIAASQFGSSTPPVGCNLARMFGDPGSYFFDDSVSDTDPIMGGPGGRPGNVHSHLYGSENDDTVSTAVYFPKGGTMVAPSTRIPKGLPGSNFLGSSRNDGNGLHNANYVLIQFATFGDLTDVTLAIFHIDNFKIEKQSDGRTRIGTIGFSGSENFGSGGSLYRKDGKKAGHSHFELLKGRKWNLNKKVLLNFRDICR